MAFILKLQEDHGEYISIAEARKLMENAANDEELQSHIKNIKKYDIFVCVTYISDYFACKTRHMIIYNSSDNVNVDNVKGVLSGKKDCVGVIPITTSKTNNNSEYQKFKYPIINRTNTGLTQNHKIPLYKNLKNIHDITFANNSSEKKISTVSRQEIVGYVGRLQIEDQVDIANYLYNWKREKSNSISKKD